MTLSTPIRPTRQFLSLSRLLLALVGALLAAIPWSERYGGLDNFPQGQDLETNILAFLALIGLMLLVAHLCRQGVAALFSISPWTCRLARQSKRRPDAQDTPALGPCHRPPL